MSQKQVLDVQIKLLG